ncbi:MAG: DEAD/DEAH box helicase [Candidatus Magasanikbacteria bacterium]|nr:DEAD/DEAH box helicase [Candidatus Magasanikbacteria bacterium]
MNSELKPLPQQVGFHGLTIAPKLVEILTRLNFVTPTPIQRQAIPAALTGKDLVGIAQTGTGKTLAFGIPMIQRLSQLRGQGLILLPTRELALQVDEELKKIGHSLGLKTAVLIGGASMQFQIRDIRRTPHLIIATPGRLADHLKQRTLSLANIKIVVLDEADRMFDIGFAPEIKRILNVVPKGRQTLLFSATMPTEIAKMAAEYMSLPLRIEVAPQGTTANNVEHEIFIVSKEVKLQLLDKLLSDYSGSVLVFSRTKHGAKKIVRVIRDMGHSAAEIHSNRSLAQRKDAMAGFKSGKYRVLVATDIAARGIDVTGIELVINYDLPDNSEDYVHRIGRTGRAGKSGKAISFATPDQRGDIKSIERLIKKALPVAALPALPPRRAPIVLPKEEFSHQGFKRSYSGGRNSPRSRRGNWRQNKR